MIVWLIRFIRGYLLIKFEGVYSEKILTDIAADRISVWALNYKNSTIYAKILAKDYKRLRPLRRNTGIKIRIAEKHGFPFFIRRYKGRAGLLVGTVIFFALLEFLSSFVWVININGNKSVLSADIMESLKEIGVYEKMPADNLNSKIMAQRLLIARNDLAWASLNLEGCVINVNVTEIKKGGNTGDKPPSNLVAAEDGIIRKIDAVSGDVRVKIGDNVHKGDVLVSGIIESMASTVFVSASGRITAQVEKTYTSRAGFTQEIKRYTGKESRKRVLEVLGIKLPLFLNGKNRDADITCKFSQLTLMGNPVPVKLYEAKHRYFDVKTIKVSETELKSILAKRLKNYLSKEKKEDYIPLSTDYKNYGEGIALIHRYLCEENIATESKILIS